MERGRRVGAASTEDITRRCVPILLFKSGAAAFYVDAAAAACTYLPFSDVALLLTTQRSRTESQQRLSSKSKHTVHQPKAQLFSNKPIRVPRHARHPLNLAGFVCAIPDPMPPYDDVRS